MPVTITVREPLAAKLMAEAQQRRVSPTHLAEDLLTRALEGAEDSSWYQTNQQRLALLHKSATTRLTPREADDLQRLQALADQRLEAMDTERLGEVERMEREVQAAARAAGGS